jgi:hypothetical protein
MDKGLDTLLKPGLSLRNVPVGEMFFSVLNFVFSE